MDCIKNIIGMSKMDCICLTEGLTTDQIEEAKKSTSGLYLDFNLEGGIKLTDIKLIDACGDYFKLAKESIEGAERAFTDDIRISLSSKYKATKAKFIGELGRLQYSGFIATQKPLQYLRIEPIGTGGATLQVDSMRININVSKSTNVKVVAVMDGLTYGDVVFESTVETQANKWINISVPPNVKLPLLVNGHKMNYYFVWEKTDNEIPVDNSITCGCSGGDAYSQYISLTGGQADDYDNLTKTSEKFAKGLSVGVQIYCETGSSICDEFNKQEAVALVSAWAVLFKAGELLNSKILMSGDVKRITMMNREAMYGMRAHFKKEYENRIAYLTSELDLAGNDCFSCSNSKMWVGNVYG